MCIKFGEDISFCSRAIIFFKHGPRLSNVLGPHCNIEWKCQLFFDNIDIHFPENISAVVWIRSAKNLGLVRKSTFRISLKFAKKRGPVDPKSQGVFSIFPDPRIPNVKILSLRQAVWELLALSRFFCCSAPYGPIGWEFDTFSSIEGYPLAKFQVSRTYGLGCTLRFTAEAEYNNNKNPYNYNRDSALRARTPKFKAASSIKRGSCFEGIRVCFYGVGQPWFIADSETPKMDNRLTETHTHTHMFNCFW